MSTVLGARRGGATRLAYAASAVVAAAAMTWSGLYAVPADAGVGGDHGLALASEETDLRPGAPTGVSATAGPGQGSVAFTAADARAVSFTVTAWRGSLRVATVTGPGSPIVVSGLSSGLGYTFTVAANGTAGGSAASLPSRSIMPTGPVTNTAAVASDRRFVNQSVSFASTAGTVSSRRPQAGESSTTTLYSPASQGVPAGKEWRLLWLRAVNCETAPRLMEFFVHQETPAQTALAKFVQNDVWRAGQPNRAVAVPVPANGGQLSWVEDRAAPLILTAGQSIGARWYGMVGGSRSCNWQFGAIEQPAGTGVAAARTSLPTVTAGASFKGDVAGLRSSWRTVPAGAYWIPESVRATNCEAGPRRMDVVLLGPGNIMQGVVTSAAGGSGPVVVPAGGTWTWTAAESSARLLLPAGWGLGVRWLDMRGDAPSGTCSWSATVSVGAPGGTSAAFDSSMG